MNKKKIIIIAAAVIVVALAAHFLLKSSPKDAFKLETTTAQHTKISSTVTATGTIEPITEVTVGTQVSGRVDKIFVDYNSTVKKGQVLAEIDKTNLQTEYNNQLQAVRASKVEYEYQLRNYNRSKELHNQHLISDTDFETAKYNYEKAETAYKQNQLSLDKAKTNLDFATIYSPIDGVVLSRAVEEGQTVAASFSTPTMFIIAKDLTKMQVVANVDEADIGNVANGQRVTFTVDAYPNDVFDGTITQVRLNPTTTSNVVTYQVIVNAPNPELKLKPGLTATITVFTVEKDAALTVPNKVFSFKPDTAAFAHNGFKLESAATNNLQPDQRSVWVQKGKTVERKLIHVGDTDGINTEVISGLNKDDQVITSMTDLSAAPQGASSGETSPFMPKRPGSDNKKQQQGGGPK